MEGLTLQLFDLVSQAAHGKIFEATLRDKDMSRLVRLLLKPQHHHVLVTGASGCGKTALIEGLAYQLNAKAYPALPSKMYRLATSPLKQLISGSKSLDACREALRTAAQQLGESIIVLEDIDQLTGDDLLRLESLLYICEPLLVHPQLRLILSCSTAAFDTFLGREIAIQRAFEELRVAEPTKEEATFMIGAHLKKQPNRAFSITEPVLASIVQHASTFKNKALPGSALLLLEEVEAKCLLENNQIVTVNHVLEVVSERTHIPVSQLGVEERCNLLHLEQHLNGLVIGQEHAMHAICSAVQRSRLGLSDPKKPRGSFLFLGPSGVGKTETARILAQLLYPQSASLVRLDMSEYSESHASVRLIGSPPGYVGYEQGGQLTNPIAKEPYSLILLDEIEKAHPRIFDLFLQVLDDGRLTDSAGTTVDFSQTLIVATSNCASQLIIDAHQQGQDLNADIFSTRLFPHLIHHFRPEFLNRFDAIIVYAPLSIEHLVIIARQELVKLQARVAHKNINFDVTDQHLAQLLRPVAQPQFGARPVKRIIQQYFETPLACTLLQHPEQQFITLTGKA